MGHPESASELDPEAQGHRSPNDRVGKDHVREPDPQMRDDHPPLRRPRGPSQDGLADHGRRVRIALEQARLAIGQELVAVIHEEQGRVARDLGGAIRGVVDRYDQRVRRQPITCHDLAHRSERRGGHDDVRARNGRPGTGSHGNRRHSIDGSRLARERLGTLRVRIE